ncbi:MAG TPA: ELWxxDGT repeat protein [Archangium sp.]|uniref:ELWxxDGT repeat protein n=1 Tax=Archangium sp. TaxID=1872627 RepID=UPI002E311BC8|nr:ELWxxDGT repeat protein [Archangium sp.]HEX5751877.1 ELWxxDGT repeat protein [Archangium sp.]
MPHRSMDWSWLLAFALAGGSYLPAHAQATPAPGCRPATLIKDVSEGDTGSSPAFFQRIGSTLYFSANGAPAGESSDIELWKSDGTAAGTARVKNINPLGDSIPDLLTDLNGTLLFTADDGEHGVELWKSDGTAAGTVMVREIGEGLESGGTTQIITMGGKAYLTATNHTEGRELWVSDGTFAGTRLVKDINPGIRGSISPGTLRVVGNTLYFAADDGTRGTELWKSDGTEAGTQLVKELAPGAGGASIGEVTVVGTTVFFTANNGTLVNDLWKSDGTEAGTVRVKDINAVSTAGSPESLVAVGGKLFFRLQDAAAGTELWVSDGTDAGSVRVKDIWSGAPESFPENLTAVGGTLYFTANDGASGVELWKSDGTAAGTVRVKDILAGGESSNPRQLTAAGPVLFFVVGDGPSARLWVSDGTDAGTREVGNLTASDPQSLTFTGGTLYLSAEDATSGREPYAVVPSIPLDCTPPAITCPANVTVEATGRSGATVNYTPATAADEGAAAPTVSYSQESGTAFAVKETEVTATATDAAGNTNTCSFKVTVKDSVAPSLLCPADVETTATRNAGAVVNYPAAQATDNVSDVTLTYSTASGATFPVGNNRVEVVATDASGNRASCSFTVKVAAAGGSSGCGCTSGLTPDAAWLLLGTLAPLLARRRRSAP